MLLNVTPQLAELADRVAALSTNDLVEVLRRVFEKHSPEPTQHVERRYFLGVSQHCKGTWEVAGVAYPLIDPMDNNDRQQGRCGRCGLEVEAPAKQANCPACLAPCSLT
jgi:hypothetical protein